MIKLISQVIADFASGEISQQEYQFDTDITLQQYLDKSFYKTATLIAASCKSAAAFSDVPVEVCLSLHRLSWNHCHGHGMLQEPACGWL